MEGYLHRWTNMVFRWSQQYFILHEDILVYCDKKGGKKLGCIHLKIASINSQPKDPLKIIINSGTTELLLKAQNATIKNQWLQAFVQAKKFQPQLNQTLEDIQQETQNNKNISSYTKKMLLNTNIHQLDKLLAQVWQSQAKLEEQISHLMPIINKMEECTQIAENIEKFSQQIKDHMTKSIFLVEDEWKHINKAYNLLNSQNNQNIINNNNKQNKYGNSNIDSYQNFQNNDINNKISINYVYDQQQQNNGTNNSQSNINETMYQSFDLDGSAIYYSNHDKSLNMRESNNKLQRRMSQSLVQSSSKVHPYTVRNLEQNVILKTLQITDNTSRDAPPVKLEKQESVSFWSILKNSIGKDLSKISFPVQLNEPLSTLQKMAEQFHYYDLLNKADQCPNSQLRMGYVIGFAISYFSTQLDRTKKPFNPLLHETYEWVNDNFTYFAEQVSHHPPISASICFNNHFELQTTSQSKTAFLGHKMEIKPQSKRYILLKQNNDKIEYNQCVSTIHNIIMGKMYIDHSGEMNFHNRSTGDTGQIIFKEKSWNGKGQYQVEGWIKNSVGEEVYKIDGYWNKSVTLIEKKSKNQIKVFEIDQNRYKQNQEYYNFTPFSLQINHIHQQVLNAAPTDTRFRPDQRALEYGKEDLAASEKNRLETKQRATRKQNQSKGHVPQPQWFQLDGGQQLTQENFNSEKEYKYVFNNTYFKRDFSKCPDIY